MKNAMSLKAITKNLANKKHISAQLVLQNFMLERLLERVSLSRFKDNFILKGGFLIASMVGLDTRATMDMDCTIKGYPVTEQQIQAMFEEICSIKVDDDISFVFRSIGEIREGDEYTGYRVALSAEYAPMSVLLKVDVTTGDVITPREIQFSYKLMLEDREIKVLAYNLETILAEKLETVISRGDQNTRPRDYYDIYVLTKLFEQNVDVKVLSEALIFTAKKRGTINVLTNYREIMHIVGESSVMNKFWQNYQKSFEYAKPVDFSEACQSVVDIMDKLCGYFSNPSFSRCY